MKSRKPYGWPEAQDDLARGVNPMKVAIRLGTYEEAVIRHSADMGWAVTYNANRTADTVERLEA